MLVQPDGKGIAKGGLELLAEIHHVTTAAASTSSSRKPSASTTDAKSLSIADGTVSVPTRTFVAISNAPAALTYTARCGASSNARRAAGDKRGLPACRKMKVRSRLPARGRRVWPLLRKLEWSP